VAEELGVDTTRSYFIGDSVRDLLPALELGGEGILVRTGYGEGEESKLPEAFVVVDNLLAAARFIVARG
jgi:phosphoglycolate phosphatase-like HAD superfamily hydrolase